jgi:predicted transcriptional regulator of viral defense system
VRGTPLRLGAERHVSSDGADALKRLERRGLVERVSRGHWRAVSVSEAWARIAGAE